MSGIPEQKPGEPFVNHRRAAWERQRGGGWPPGARGGIEGAGRSDPRRPDLSAGRNLRRACWTSSRAFPQPVPLVEMVDFLVEVWDEDGLYD